MKIYNKIIIEWNDETQSYDRVVYEDSYEYDGELMLADEYCPACIDLDGNTYSTTIIDDKCWMSQNLRTTVWQNGIAIEDRSASPNFEQGDANCFMSWMDGTDAECCGYWTQDPDMTDPELNQNSTEDILTYGYLYNWFAAMPQETNGNDNNQCGSAQGDNICPEGWDLPTHQEWNEMERHLCETYSSRSAAQCAVDFPYGGENSAYYGDKGTFEGGILKEPGYEEWTYHTDAGDDYDYGDVEPLPPTPPPARKKRKKARSFW